MQTTVGQEEQKSEENQSTERLASSSDESTDPSVSSSDDKDWLNKNADFMMYKYKIERCSNNNLNHNKEECPYVHEGDKETRRDPQTTNYDQNICRPIRKGKFCEKGNKCSHAHSLIEHGLHPRYFRTQYCENLGRCIKQICFFAHNEGELRWLDDSSPPPPLPSSSSNSANYIMSTLDKIFQPSPDSFSPKTKARKQKPCAAFNALQKWKQKTAKREERRRNNRLWRQIPLGQNKRLQEEDKQQQQQCQHLPLVTSTSTQVSNAWSSGNKSRIFTPKGVGINLKTMPPSTDQKQNQDPHLRTSAPSDGQMNVTGDCPSTSSSGLTEEKSAISTSNEAKNLNTPSSCTVNIVTENQDPNLRTSAPSDGQMNVTGDSPSMSSSRLIEDKSTISTSCEAKNLNAPSSCAVNIVTENQDPNSTTTALSDGQMNVSSDPPSTSTSGLIEDKSVISTPNEVTNLNTPSTVNIVTENQDPNSTTRAPSDREMNVSSDSPSISSSGLIEDKSVILTPNEVINLNTPSSSTVNMVTENQDPNSTATAPSDRQMNVSSDSPSTSSSGLIEDKSVIPTPNEVTNPNTPSSSTVNIVTENRDPNSTSSTLSDGQRNVTSNCPSTSLLRSTEGKSAIATPTDEVTDLNIPSSSTTQNRNLANIVTENQDPNSTILLPAFESHTNAGECFNPSSTSSAPVPNAQLNEDTTTSAPRTNLRPPYYSHLNFPHYSEVDWSHASSSLYPAIPFPHYFNSATRSRDPNESMPSLLSSCMEAFVQAAAPTDPSNIATSKPEDDYDLQNWILSSLDFEDDKQGSAQI